MAAHATVTVWEPKGAAMASYCRRSRVDRGTVQCQKRWSNLACDFKKIRAWEKGKGAAEGESFWAMRNDRRREWRLLGFFDREVYEILDGVAGVEAEGAVEEEEEEEEEGKKALAAEEEDDDEDEEAIFDIGRTVADDGLFSDFEQEEAVAATDEAEERPWAMVVVPARAPLVRVNQGNEKERKKIRDWGTIWPSGTALMGHAWLGTAPLVKGGPRAGPVFFSDESFLAWPV